MTTTNPATPFSIRKATADDAATILAFIRALAVYEREPDAVETTEEVLRSQLRSDWPPFECLIAESAEDGPLGFALFCHNYSTWRGSRGVWLEDLFVPPEVRGRGVGKALLSAVAAVAVERGCKRMEWAVLDWNQLAIDFYQRLGAVGLEEWTIFRISDERLLGLSRG